MGTDIFFHQDMTSTMPICLSILPQTQEPSPCLRPNPISIWWLAGETISRCKSLDIQQASQSQSVEWDFTAGARLDILQLDYSFPKPSLICLLSRREVPSSICDNPGSTSWNFINSPIVIGAGAAASSAIYSWRMASTSHLDWMYFFSLLQKELVTSSHLRGVNSSSLICIWRNLTMYCCTVLVIVPITLPGSSSSLSWPCSISSSS